MPMTLDDQIDFLLEKIAADRARRQASEEHWAVFGTYVGEPREFLLAFGDSEEEAMAHATLHVRFEESQGHSVGVVATKTLVRNQWMTWRVIRAK